MQKSQEELLREMARIAERNKELVAKALGLKPKTRVSPYVVYARPSQR